MLTRQIGSMTEAVLSELFEKSTDKGSPTDRFYVYRGKTISVFIHHILRSDDVDTFHTHPWPGLSLIFGEYREELLGFAPARRRFYNWISAVIPHRVDVDRPVWTVFIHGPRAVAPHPVSGQIGWGMFGRDGTVRSWNPWRGPNAGTNNK